MADDCETKNLHSVQKDNQMTRVGDSSLSDSEVVSQARGIVARLIVSCEMDDLDQVVAGVRALGALFGEPDEEARGGELPLFAEEK